jgi:hypothetical protein
MQLRRLLAEHVRFSIDGLMGESSTDDVKGAGIQGPVVRDAYPLEHTCPFNNPAFRFAITFPHLFTDPDTTNHTHARTHARTRARTQCNHRAISGSLLLS